MTIGFIANLVTAWFLHRNQHRLDAEAFQLAPNAYRRIGRPQYIVSVSHQHRTSQTTFEATVTKNGGIKIQGDDNDESTKDQEETLNSKKNRNYSLNSEIYYLRKKRNGNFLAEQRLETAIQQLTQKKDLHKDDHYTKNDQLPDEVTFNSVIMAHAKNAYRDRHASSRGERLLRRMEELSKEYPHLSPTIFTYNAVMEAYSKTITASSEGSNSFKETVMIKGRDRSPVARLYMELQELGLTPNTYTWNLVLASVPQDSKQWVSLEEWAFAFLRSENLVVDNVENLPDRQTYNVLFKLFANSGAFGKAERLLHQLTLWNHQQQDEDSSTILKPSIVWYHCVLRALAATNEMDCNAKEKTALQVLREMNELSRHAFEALQPNTETFNHVLNVYALTGGYSSALQLLDEMEHGTVSNQTARSNLVPDCVSYTTTMKSFATAQQNSSFNKTQLLELAEGATEIFERMMSSTQPNNVSCKSYDFIGNPIFKNSKPLLLRDKYLDNTLINIWVNVGTRESLQKAEALLRDLKSVDSVSLVTLIHGWSKTRLPEAGSRAKNLFDELLQLPPSLQRRTFSITTVCNSVMSCIARFGEVDCPKKVESLLSQLEGRFLNGDNSAEPDKTSFLCVFDAYAKAGIPDAEERCDSLLNRMDHYREVFGLKALEPDRAVYNAYLNALAKSQQPSAVEKAEEILTMMETSRNHDLRPDIVTYSTFIDCHTKCGERSLERADELLRFVEGTYRRGDATLKPNAVFYSAVLQAWAKTCTSTGAEKAEELLQRNIALFEEGNEFAKPHIIVYNAVMDALARGGVPNAGSRAEELLDEAESLYQAGDIDMKPTRRTFNAVILAYRAEGNAGAKAEELLDRMEGLANCGRNEVRPDVVTYNNVISAVVQDSTVIDSSADKAQSLLDRMEECGVTPDGRTYGLVIETWLRRNDEKGSALADALLNQFQDMLQDKRVKAKSRQNYLYEDAVWNVINAYRRQSENDTLKSFFDYQLN
jgi:hypothetical protein